MRSSGDLMYHGSIMVMRQLLLETNLNRGLGVQKDVM
ncbi:hypothetical protein APH_0563 [Anaplasma phagocytophilum str. HZ]|uniref:Uncharacterized protein n=3 Tax=Anaplasma phagocytophilum TaxID=948 RepID=A0A098EH63_ANAPH|nr:hypothetical protein APH_0563 [Anaplasma phagocytophilum str. HZ]CEG20651.1 Uncharacterized protein ANAPHAGO_00680 [Anaplasma phagocytophilum]